MAREEQVKVSPCWVIGAVNSERDGEACEPPVDRGVSDKMIQETSRGPSCPAVRGSALETKERSHSQQIASFPRASLRRTSGLRTTRSSTRISVSISSGASAIPVVMQTLEILPNIAAREEPASGRIGRGWGQRFRFLPSTEHGIPP